MTTLNPVNLLQNELRDRLLADPYFADITVLSEREGNISYIIAKGLKLLTKKDDKIGVAVIVGLFSADVNNDNVPGPHFDDGATLATVFENPLLNSGAAGTGKAAVDIAVRAAQILHHYYPAGIGQTLLVTGKPAVDPVLDLPPGIVGYSVRVAIALDSIVLGKVGQCTISPAGGAVPQEVTLTCETAAASIYYTLDYSYPYAGNTNATLYTVPFTISAAAMLRVVAHKTDLVASDAAAADFT